MLPSTFSVDHHLAELRQLGDELRSARYAEQVRHAGSKTRPSFAAIVRDLVSHLAAPARPTRLGA